MAKSDADFESVKHTCLRDVWIGPDFMIVRIKATKTRGLLQEPLLFPISRIPGSLLCPVAAMERHMRNLLAAPRQSLPDDPLFQFISIYAFTGKALGKDSASKEISSRCAQEVGRKCPEWSGRSCRVTGATLLMRQGVAEWLVRWMGDWKESTQWSVYVRTPLPELLNITKQTGQALKM